MSEPIIPTPHLAKLSFEARRAFYAAKDRPMCEFSALPPEIQELERSCAKAVLSGLREPGALVLDDGARALAEINGVSWGDLTPEGKASLTASANAIWSAMIAQAEQDLKERHLWMA